MSLDRLTDGKTAKIVLSFQGELKSIQEQHPDLAARVDVFSQQIRDKMQAIREQIDQFPMPEREMVQILVINGIHKTTDEVFL